MADVDPAFVQQIFDVPKRKRKTNIQHYRQADDLGAGFEVFERGWLGHSQTLRNRPARLNTSSSDSAFLANRSLLMAMSKCSANLKNHLVFKCFRTLP
ncbi:hypothetical protein [Sulfitobacter sediminilitoris]|uniref:hypothetical protein n=1 Tax=Sulfitobacter sediminilitoris TaxID=2698830 RepID=UPI002E289585|nr:hypothetical protein [Sulfitobacter sediminilitoris]